jgi:hypothetical protein
LVFPVSRSFLRYCSALGRLNKSSAFGLHLEVLEMTSAILLCVGVTLGISAWMIIGESIPQSFGPAYFALPFVLTFLVWLISGRFKKR